MAFRVSGRSTATAVEYTVPTDEDGVLPSVVYRIETPVVAEEIVTDFLPTERFALVDDSVGVEHCIVYAPDVTVESPLPDL